MINLRIASTFISLIAVSISAIILFEIKYKVQEIKKQLVAIQVEITKERENIHVLNAEWAYLTQPQTLQKLAKKHLDLVPVDSRRITTLEIATEHME